MDGEAQVYGNAQVSGGELYGTAKMDRGEFYDGMKFGRGNYGKHWYERQRRVQLANSIVELYGDSGDTPPTLPRGVEYTGTGKSNKMTGRRGRGSVRY